MQNFVEEIVHQKEPIGESLTNADRFIYQNKDKYLKQEQQKELTTKMSDLRRGYDDIGSLADARLRELQSALGHRRKEKEEMVRTVMFYFFLYLFLFSSTRFCTPYLYQNTV